MSSVEKEDKVGVYKYIAEPFHVDFRGKLSLGILGNHLLNCAGFHSNDRGFGMVDLNEGNFTWVLSRLAIEFKDMPKQYESFTITSWVENVYRLFTDRNYALYNHKEECIGYARSVWAMINMDTRRPANLFELYGAELESFIADEPCPIEKPSRIKVTAKEPKVRLKVKYTDIDINRHLNSIRYIEHILDLFPLEFYKEHGVKRFEIAYVAECYFGDELSFYVDELENNEYQIEILRNDDNVVCRSKVVFN